MLPPPALTSTLILPGDNGSLAARLLAEIIQDRVMAIFVVLGDHEEVVRRADHRASAYPGVRHVVWIPNPELAELADRVAAFRGADPSVIAVVLSFTDTVVRRYREGEPLDNIAIEAGFFQGMKPPQGAVS